VSCPVKSKELKVGMKRTHMEDLEMKSWAFARPREECRKAEEARQGRREGIPGNASLKDSG